MGHQGTLSPRFDELEQMLSETAGHGPKDGEDKFTRAKVPITAMPEGSLEKGGWVV
jgi:hypothetical protein